MKRHLETVHKKCEDIAAHMVDGKLDNTYYTKLRVEGMENYNRRCIANNDTPSKLQRERRPKHGVTRNIKMCDGCKKFLGGITFYKHKCSNDLWRSPKRIYQLVAREMHKDKQFRTDVLDKFRDSAVGDLCRENSFIKEIGFRMFCKRRHEKSKLQTCLKGTMQEMRQLAHMFITYKKQPGAGHNIEDMFRSGEDHTNILYSAIDEYGKDETTKHIKHGKMLNLRAMISRTSKHLQALYDEQGQKDKAEDIAAFRRQFTYRDPEIFGAAQYLSNERSFVNRRPDSLPDQELATQLHSYVKSRIQEVTEDFQIGDYTALRDLVVSRLTLYNARRGEEGTQMRLIEWDDAKNQVWLGEKTVNDSAVTYLVDQYLLAYMPGKGKKYVPILIPKDCVQSVDILIERRFDYGIPKSNIFVFASKGSYNHCSGWHAINNVVRMIPGLKINATMNRHLVSTVYTSLDMTPSDAKIFFQHISHTEDISRENYRCPPGAREMTVMGPVLQDITEGRTYLYLSLSTYLNLSLLPSQKDTSTHLKNNIDLSINIRAGAARRKSNYLI